MEDKKDIGEEELEIVEDLKFLENVNELKLIGPSNGIPAIVEVYSTSANGDQLLITGWTKKKDTQTLRFRNQECELIIKCTFRKEGLYLQSPSIPNLIFGQVNKFYPEEKKKGCGKGSVENKVPPEARPVMYMVDDEDLLVEVPRDIGSSSAIYNLKEWYEWNDGENVSCFCNKQNTRPEPIGRGTYNQELGPDTAALSIYLPYGATLKAKATLLSLFSWHLLYNITCLFPKQKIESPW